MAATQPSNPNVAYHHRSSGTGDPNDCAVDLQKGPFKNNSGSGDANDIVLFSFYRPSDGRLTNVIYDSSTDSIAVVS